MKFKMRALQSAAVGVSIAMTSMTSHAVVMQDDAANLNSNNQSTQPDSLEATIVQTRRIIVEYNNQLAAVQSNSLDSTQSATIANSASLAAGAELKHLRQMGTGEHVFVFDEKMDLKNFQTAVKNLAADPTIVKVSEDKMMRIMATPNDPNYDNQWHYYEPTGGLNLPDAWYESTGAGVVVAVIDTGITDHSDLNANVLPGYDMISDLGVANDGDGRDSDPSDPGDAQEANECPPPNNQASNSSWHGTHVAGTVAAVTNNNSGIAGVAYDAKVVPIRGLGVCGGFTSDIADGIIWAAGGSVPGVPDNQNPAQVINMSLGGGGSCSSTYQSAINTAVGFGATVVVAAGNSSTNAANASPASCQNVVTVASVGRNGGAAFYTNFGDVVDVAAPGGDQSTGGSDGVLSTLNTGLDGPGSETFAYYQGTSMASPHVAGAVALMYAIDPDITPAEAESLLESTARSFPSTCTGCGAGIVDAAAAVDAISGGGGNDGGGGGQAPSIDISNISGTTNQWQQTTLEVPAGQSELTVQISGGSGDADLYVRRGANPTTTVYDCRPYLDGNNEVCTFENPQEGTWFIRLRGFRNYSGVRLQAASQ